MPKEQTNLTPEQINIASRYYDEVSPELVHTMHFVLKAMNLFASMGECTQEEISSRLKTLADTAGIDLGAINTKPDIFKDTLLDRAYEALKKEGLITEDPDARQLPDLPNREKSWVLVDSRRQEYYDRIYGIECNQQVLKSISDLAKIYTSVSGWKVAEVFKDLIGRAEAAKTEDETEKARIRNDIQESLEQNKGSAVKSIAKVFEPVNSAFEAYLAIDKKLRPDRTPIKSLASRDAKEAARNFSLSKTVSVVNGFLSVLGYAVVFTRNEFTYKPIVNIREKRGVLGWLMDKLPGEKAPDAVEARALKFFEAADSAIKTGYNILAEKIGGIDDAMNKSQMLMMDERLKAEKTSFEQRTSMDSTVADGFVRHMARTNVFRCGNSSYIPGWCHVLHMTERQSAHALLNLATQMRATLDGVEFTGRTIREYKKEEVALEKAKDAKAVHQAYEAIEKIFIREHAKLVAEVTEMRKAANLEPLDPQIHFNTIYDNPEPQKRLTYVEMDFDTWRSDKTDVDAILKDKDAIAVRIKNGVAGFFKGEDRSIAALLDRRGRAENMEAYITFGLQVANAGKDISARETRHAVHKLMVNYSDLRLMP